MATQMNVPDVVTNPFASAQTALQFGPQTQQALRHSQYLADALRAMQENGSQNIRSGGELAAKLLANVILMRKNDFAQDALVQAMQGDRQGQIAAATAGTPLDGQFQAPAPITQAAPQGGFLSHIARAVFGGPLTSPAQAAPPVAMPDAAPSASFVSRPPPEPPQPTDPGMSAPKAPTGPGTGLSLTDPTTRLLAQLAYHEARGEPAAGQQAVAAVALNRARESGLPLDQVAFAPHQFSGFTPQRAASIPDTELARILPNIAPALSGQDNTNGADHFYNPSLAHPSWGQGDGLQIGQHKFMALGYGGGQPQPGGPQQPGLDTVAANAPPPSPPDPNGPPMQPVTGAALGQPFTPPTQGQGAQPYEVAANGPTPPPPAAPAQTAPAVASPPQAVAQASALASTIPHQTVTPEEWQHAAALVRNWHTYDAGMAYLEKLKQRAASPIEMKPGTYFGPDGQAHSVEQLVDQPGAPNAFVQRSNLDNSVHVTANPAYGNVAPGMKMGDTGTVTPVPVKQLDHYRIPGAPGFYVDGPDGHPVKVADDAYSVKDVGSTMQELTSSQQYDKAAKLTEMYRGAVAAAGRPGGISDAELKDNAAQIFSGGVARQFNAKMLDEGQGPLLRLKQFAPEIVSGQKLSPQAREAMLRAMHDYATEAQAAFGGLAQSKSTYAAQNGVDISPFIKPLMQPLPDVPDINGIPNGMQGYGAPAAPPDPDPIVQTPAGPMRLSQVRAIAAQGKNGAHK